MAKRPLPKSLVLLRFAFRWLDRLFPTLAIRLAYRLWFRSPRFSLSRRETRARESSTQQWLGTEYGDIRLYRWGDRKQPAIILLHGWSGHATQLAGFARPLCDAGFQVIGFDAPGHGQSQGNATTIFRIADVLQQIVGLEHETRGIIAHSFGCMVSAYAIHHYKLPISAMVAISSPTDAQYLIDGYAATMQFSQRVKLGFTAKLKQHYGGNVLDIIAADTNLKDWHGRLLVIHDKDDMIVDWHYSERLARAVPGSEQYYTEQLGHRRLLFDGKVIEKTVQFLSGGRS